MSKEWKDFIESKGGVVKGNDITYRDEGTVILFTVLTDEAMNWVDEHTDIESWQWTGQRSFAVDRRPAIQLIEGMKEDLTVMEVRS